MKNFSRLLLGAALLSLVACQSLVVNTGCKTIAADGISCQTCSDRFYKDPQGICQPVSTSCRTYSSVDGTCTGCYDGYYLLETICLFDNRPPTNPYCAKFENQLCILCSKGFYLSNGDCKQIDTFCKTFDVVAIACTECYPGYTTSPSGCVLANITGVADGCAQFNQSVCVKCSKDYYFAANRSCLRASSLCKGFDSNNGNCLACFPGFKLNGGDCIVDDGSALNPFCQKFENGACSKCSNGYYFDSQLICQLIDPLCKKFDETKGVCLGCYMGFSLVNNNCLVPESLSTDDLNCQKFDDAGICVNCSKGYYFNVNKVCTQIDPKCKSFNVTSLLCTACYPGYALVNNNCEVSVVQSQSSACAQWADDFCVKCVPRAYYDVNANCIMVSDSCKTFNTFNGHCTSCYPGNAVSTQGECLPSVDSPTSCAGTDAVSGLCNKCYNGSYLSAESKCVEIDAFCQTFNKNTRLCEQCFKGYAPSGATCQKATVSAEQSIANCFKYTTAGQCQECYKLYYLSNNECIEADPLCKTFDPSNGRCLTCYSSFTLKDGRCIQ